MAKRYYVEMLPHGSGLRRVETDNGEYMLHSDYAELESKAAELEKENARLDGIIKARDKEIEDLRSKLRITGLDIDYKTAVIDQQKQESKDNYTAQLEIQTMNLQEIESLKEEAETLRMQLTACGVAALSNTEKSCKEQRIYPGNPYWSSSYADVCNAVDREMKHRSEAVRLLSALNEIAPLFGVNVAFDDLNTVVKHIRIGIAKLCNENAELSKEVERLRRITSVDYLHEVFSRSIHQLFRYDGGWGGEFPELDYYIHELQKRAFGEHLEEIKRKDADIAALVTALDEYHQAYTNHSEFISENGFDSLGFVVCEITPASRATAEKWLKKEE